MLSDWDDASKYWDEIISNRTWAEPYFRSLSKLDKDLKLRLETKSKIYISMDFFDIYEHCFPKLSLFIDNGPSQEREEFLKREAARYALFFIFKNLYNHPILILPPHFSELISFYNINSKRISDITKSDDFSKIEEYIKKLISNYTNIDDISSKELIDRLGKDAPELAFLFSPCFMSGLKGLRNLFTKHVISPVFDAYDFSKDDYFSLITNTSIENNTQNELLINKWRNYGKYFNNKRDAKAIQYVQKINDNISNNILLFISSDLVFNRYKYERDLIFKKYIEQANIECPLIRSTYPTYIALIELCNMLGLKEQNTITDGDDSILAELQSHISKDLETLSQYLGFSETSAYVSLSGRYSIYLDFLLNALKGQRMAIDQRDRIALLILLEKQYMKGELFNWNEDLKQKLNDYFLKLRSEIETNDFSNIILERILEFDQEKDAFEKSINQLISIDSKQENYGSSIYIFLLNIVDDAPLSLELLQKQFDENKYEFPNNAGLSQIKDNLWAMYNSIDVNIKLYFINKNNQTGFQVFMVRPKHIYILLTILMRKIEDGLMNKDEIKSNLAIAIMNDELVPLIETINIDFEYKSEIQILYDQINLYMK